MAADDLSGPKDDDLERDDDFSFDDEDLDGWGEAEVLESEEEAFAPLDPTPTDGEIPLERERPTARMPRITPPPLDRRNTAPLPSLPFPPPADEFPEEESAPEPPEPLPPPFSMTMPLYTRDQVSRPRAPSPPPAEDPLEPPTQPLEPEPMLPERSLGPEPFPVAPPRPLAAEFAPEPSPLPLAPEPLPSQPFRPFSPVASSEWEPSQDTPDLSPALAVPHRDPVASAAPTGAPPAASPELTEKPGGPTDLPPPIDPLPFEGPLPSGENTWLGSFQVFQRESQRLARTGSWRQLAAMTGQALLHAPFSRRMTRTALLQDLARIYRDRLGDESRAEQAFAILANEDPSNAEALGYLVELYEARAEWGEIYDRYLRAVEKTWDPNERLSWTRLAADLAIGQMNNVSLGIKAWEVLWQLGDALEDASRELTRLYRLAGRWADIARFLEQQVQRQEGAAQLVTLRELAEVKLAGLKDPDGASKVLEQIIEQSPQDPIASLQLARVYAQRQDWAALERLGRQAAAQEVPALAALDLQHLVADALWQVDRREQAITAYDRILRADPADHLANVRKRDFLIRTERFEELLDLLVTKADLTDDDDERAALLAEAAQLAEEKLQAPERAAKLWERRITIDAEHLLSFVALERLFRALGDQRGVARALEGQLALTREARRRIQLLSQLGRHYAVSMGDDDRAEGCWKEILSLDPSDIPSREELIDLHRRRGDFESLNSALMRQIWLTADVARAETLCRLAAENLDENFQDSPRSIAAWQRVIDLVPTDLAALRALSRHYAAQGLQRAVIATLELQLRAVEDLPAKIEIAARIAALWTEEKDGQSAAAAYERILHWDPTNAVALDGLVTIYREAGEPGHAIGALEHAAALLPPAERIPLLRRVLQLLPAEDHAGRFFLLRRIHRLEESAGADLTELKQEAEAATLWPEMAALLTQLACEQPAGTARVQLLQELAGICEKKLDSRVRALLALEEALLQPGNQAELRGEIMRLGRQTKRFEDLLMILDRLTTTEFDLAARKDAIRQKSAICEKDIHDPGRAFHELRRLLELDPADWEPLVELERLAQEHSLWFQLDAVIAELLDRTTGRGLRLDLLGRRERIAREKIGSRSRAFDLVLERYRLESQDLDLLRQITEDAEALEGWRWVLPLLEATQLCAPEKTAAREMAVTAALYESKLQDTEHAFSLYALAFTLAPEGGELANKLEVLAAQIGRFDQLIDCFRIAAAASASREQTVDLLRRIAAIYEKQLEAPARAVDIHRRLLWLQDDEMRSLEVMINWHRERSEWRDLRDRLRQWVHLTPSEMGRIPKLLEIATISEQHLQDPETALETYGEILAIDGENPIARDGLNGLVVSITEPGLRLRWLRMELKDAPLERAVQLRLEIAGILEEDLGDIPGAIETLRLLIADTGADGPGFAPLARLLRASAQWRDLILLLQAKASALTQLPDQLAALEESVTTLHQHLDHTDPALREEIYRSKLRLEPADRETRVLLARLLRDDGRFEELATLLQENLQHLETPFDRAATRYELARLYDLNLDRSPEAQTVWREILEESSEEEGAFLALARTAAAEGDIPAYLAWRQKQAKLLPPHSAALVLCHLAEVADENESVAEMMVPFYREARGLDPANVPAMEALKGIGRRLKQLRPTAALLPLEGERALSTRERAKRLMALGDATPEEEPTQAIEWYERSLAVDPDQPAAWNALAERLETSGDRARAYRARCGALQALERIEPLDPARLHGYAELLHRLALSARAAEETEGYARWIHRAFELVPGHAPSALATARVMLDADDNEAAHRLLDEVLTRQLDELDRQQKVIAHYNRGLTFRNLARSDQAMDDLREALRLQPLHAQALIAMGEMQAKSGRVAAAIEHQIRALMVVQDPKERARLYYRLGVLWDDALAARPEAGACYELALAEGLTDRDLLHRSLRHFQRSGRLEESIDVVNGLLPTASDPEELATLWLVRGEIYAAREGFEDQAIDAFDMALSYDPSRQEARDGLTVVLERRGDWDQLLQVLEATCDAGTPEQQGAALERMAAICRAELGDTKRAESYLRRSVDTFPTRGALEQLENLFTPDSGRLQERREVLGLLVGFGPPWFERCLELARLVLEEDKYWAWCLLSPLLGVSQVDPDIKAVVQSMRKDHERTPILSPAAEDHDLLRHPSADRRLTEVLNELGGELHPLGINSLEDAGDAGAIPISETTSLGKTFAGLAGAMGLGGSSLYRAQEIPESVSIINAAPHPLVMVRTDVMQQLVHAEVGFLFAYALELARPGHRVMAALPRDSRDHLVPALWLALDFVESTGKSASKLAERIRESTDEGRRAAWAAALTPLRGLDPLEFGRRWWQGVLTTARRTGLLAGADLRQVFRVIARLDPSIPRPRVVARLEELDEYVAGSEILQELISFAASPSFGRVLHGAAPAVEQ